MATQPNPKNNPARPASFSHSRPILSFPGSAQNAAVAQRDAASSPAHHSPLPTSAQQLARSGAAAQLASPLAPVRSRPLPPTAPGPPASAPVRSLTRRPRASALFSPLPSRLRATAARDHRRGRRDPYPAAIPGPALLNPSRAPAPPSHPAGAAQTLAAAAALPNRRRSSAPPRTRPSAASRAARTLAPAPPRRLESSPVHHHRLRHRKRPNLSRTPSRVRSPPSQFHAVGAVQTIMTPWFAPQTRRG